MTGQGGCRKRKQGRQALAQADTGRNAAAARATGQRGGRGEQEQKAVVCTRIGAIMVGFATSKPLSLLRGAANTPARASQTVTLAGLQATAPPSLVPSSPRTPKPATVAVAHSLPSARPARQRGLGCLFVARQASVLYCTGKRAECASASASGMHVTASDPRKLCTKTTMSQMQSAHAPSCELLVGVPTLLLLGTQSATAQRAGIFRKRHMAT
jgi:hypothetical protein